jgi:photosystem II stability/assembly factor-like uncharacterized protein
MGIKRARAGDGARGTIFAIAALVAAFAGFDRPAVGDSLPEDWAAHLEWRSIGPANMSGRIVDLAVYEADPSIWWAATASGGLLKTTNNGATFTHQFDSEKVVSIGDVAVAQSNPDIIWVGTGESNPRNSVSWGNGVYKSTDGGTTWTHMGLDDAFQIGRMQIHPANPDIVYVAALGRLWGPNEQRGLYKTEDGGETWKHMYFINDETGVVDVQMHPTDPDTLIIATYERQRDGFDTNDPAKRWGDGSGLYRSNDAGETWEPLMNGLPTVLLGRMGIDYSRSNPDTVYALIESDRIGSEPENAAYMGIRGENADVGARLMEVTKDAPADVAGLKVGDIIVRLDDRLIHSYAGLLTEIRRHLADESVRIEVSRERETVELEVTFAQRPETQEQGEEDQPRRRQRPAGDQNSPFRGRLGGQIENVQDQQGNDGHENGGLYKSTDGGDNWERINSVNPRPMYFSQIRVDPSDENFIYVLGVALYKSEDGGKTFSDDGAPNDVHVDHHALWVDPNDGRHMILGNDGGVYVTHDRMESFDHLNRFAIGQFYHVTTDSRVDYHVYGGLQDNGSWGAPANGRAGGTINEDWFRVGSGDGFVCRTDPNDPDLVYYESQNGGMGRVNLRTGERGFLRPRGQRGTQYRFNWNTPFILSDHNSRIFYTAGNHVFMSLDRGNDLNPISPEITPTDSGSATALSESPADPFVLYVGTDDGGLWGTDDGGVTWIDLFAPTDDDEKAAEVAENADSAETTTATDKTDNNPDAATNDPVTGVWDANAIGEMIPPDRGGFTLTLKLADDGTVTGTMDSEMNVGEISDGTFDREASRLHFRFAGQQATMTIEGVIDNDAIAGTLAIGSMFTLNFEGTRPRTPEVAADDSDATKDPAAAESATRPIATLIPDRRWVSSLEASRFTDRRVYVTLDGHRSDDDACYAFVSDDFGLTWRSLTSDLPDDAGSARVLREDRTNRDILYLGTEFGAWVSIDSGTTWTSLNTNLPTVAVHEFAQHPILDDIVVATHGRSLWVLDATMLRQLSTNIIESSEAHLFTPATARYWKPSPERGGSIRAFAGENRAGGATIEFVLPRNSGEVRLIITDATGRTVRTLDVDANPGFQRVSWDLRQRAAGNSRRRFGPRVEPGTYGIVLEVDDERLVKPLRIAGDPSHPDVVLWGDEYDERVEIEHMSDEEEGGPDTLSRIE